MWRWSRLGVAVIVSLAMARCLDPTEVRVVLSTDLDLCSHVVAMKIVLGSLGSLDTMTESATVDLCGAGRAPHSLGDIVLVPAGDSQGAVGLEVVVAEKGTKLEDCSPSTPSGCIFARRALRYLPHTPLRLSLDSACVGVACLPHETCVGGMCKDATIVDPAQCHDTGCDQGSLVAPPLPGPPTAVKANPIEVAVVTTLAGGAAGFADGTGSAASFNGPTGVAVDALGNVYVADSGNNRIRRVTPIGVVTTLAGSGAAGFADGASTSASFNGPAALAVDGSGSLYVADTTNDRIRIVTSAGLVTTLAGSNPGYGDGVGAAAMFNHPAGVALDASGNVYVADEFNQRIRKVTSAGVVTTVAGSGTAAFADGTGPSASFWGPQGVAIDGAGNLYVADATNERIRRVSAVGLVTTLAGSSSPGASNGLGTGASFNSPASLAVDGAGTVYVGDAGNNLIRRLRNDGSVTTLAGSGSVGVGDGLGVAASFSSPFGVALDTAGSLYVADASNHRIRKVTTPGALVVSWLASTSEVGLYVASASAMAQPTRICTTFGALTCTIGGLASGVAYTVTVTATNGGGESGPSTSVVATPN